MANSVKLKTLNGTKPWLEFRKNIEDDFSYKPQVFNNEIDDYASLNVFDQYGMIFPNGVDEKPLVFLRHANVDKFRFAGLIEPGNSPLEPQKGGYFKELAQKDAVITTKYQKLGQDPFVYGYGSEQPFCEYRFYENYSTWKESDVFDLKAEPFMPTVYDHETFLYSLSQMFTQCKLSGTFLGKPVEGVGGNVRIYMKQSDRHDIGSDLGYINAEGNGLRLDGRWERFIFNYDFHGKMAAFYWLEGEEPVIVDEADMETEWYHLPYVNDGTCIFKKAIFRIGNKVIHYEGKWGCKGFTEKPRIERHGQAHIFGTWYEGDTPYKHQMYMTISENMEVYDYKLKEMGFKVIDD